MTRLNPCWARQNERDEKSIVWNWRLLDFLSGKELASSGAHWVDLTPSRISRGRQSGNSETTGVRAYQARANDGDVFGSAYLTTDHH